MYFKYKSYHYFLFAFCVCLKCVFTLGSTVHAAGKDIDHEENIKTSTQVIGLDSVDKAIKVNKKSDKVLEISLNKPPNGMSQSSVPSKVPPKFVLEGGDIVDLTSTAQPSSSLLETETGDDSANHSKGSKPRKGVQHPGSSIVPRKGVDPLGAFNSNQSSSSATTGSTKEATIGDSQTALNKSELIKVQPVHPQVNEQPTTKKIPHPKKPVVVTDIEDVDDFEKYPIIQTSTTGEDYIIIGIVIVLGIWCSIFGALIFYRRAGEYWDRRHYRRMDFLVEGMYND